jgi:hypothetical protein
MGTQAALVLSREPLGVGETLYISVKVLRRSGSATVRHCMPHGTKFLIGLEFTGLFTANGKR